MICQACRREVTKAGKHKEGRRGCPVCHQDFEPGVFSAGEPERFFGRAKQRVARLRARRLDRNRKRNPNYAKPLAGAKRAA